MLIIILKKPYLKVLKKNLNKIYLVMFFKLIISKVVTILFIFIVAYSVFVNLLP